MRILVGEATVAAVEWGNPGIFLITDVQPLEVCVWLRAYAQWSNAPPPPLCRLSKLCFEQTLPVSSADAI